MQHEKLFKNLPQMSSRIYVSTSIKNKNRKVYPINKLSHSTSKCSRAVKHVNKLSKFERWR